MTNKVLTLADVALIGNAKKAPYTPFGYIIDAEARVLGLTKQWCHGVVLAILYPELAAAEGYEPPTEDENRHIEVFKYQRFELDHSRTLPVIRVAQSQMIDEIMVSSSDIQPTELQLQALLAVLNLLGLRGTDSLSGDGHGRTVNDLMAQLRSPPAPFEEESEATPLRSPFSAREDDEC
jgi:hypothetical protein